MEDFHEVYKALWLYPKFTGPKLFGKLFGLIWGTFWFPSFCFDFDYKGEVGFSKMSRITSIMGVWVAILVTARFLDPGIL